MNPAILAGVISSSLKKKFPGRNILVRVPVKSLSITRFVAMEDGVALAGADIGLAADVNETVRLTVNALCESEHLHNPSMLFMVQHAVSDFLKKEFPDAGFIAQTEAPNSVTYNSSEITYAVYIKGKNAENNMVSGWVGVADEEPAEVLEMVREECNAILGKVYE